VQQHILHHAAQVAPQNLQRCAIIGYLPMPGAALIQQLALM
jgi:hypothetical protein